MAIWSGRKKALTILLFTAPTLLGILVFNVYPIILNTYISFTNRTNSHPQPDCSLALSSILIPNCWSIFKSTDPGLASPYGILDPAYKNYATLLGRMFTSESLLNFGRLLLFLAPLGAVLVVNKRFERLLPPPLPAWLVWLIGIAVIVGLYYALSIPQAWKELLTTGTFMAVVMRTVLFVLVRVPVTFVIGLFLALILNSKWIKARAFFRVVLFLPWAASSMAILMSLVWKFFFNENGTINQILRLLFGPEAGSTIYLQDPTWAFLAIVITDIWFSYPFVMIVVLGALQSISSEVYEAAGMDGANWWRQLTSITLPLIRPAVLPAMVLTSITAFQMFGTAFAMTGGGPAQGAGQPGATEFVMVYAYKQAFQVGNYGLATAFAVIIFIFLFTATLLSLRMTKITKGAYE